MRFNKSKSQITSTKKAVFNMNNEIRLIIAMGICLTSCGEETKDKSHIFSAGEPCANSDECQEGLSCYNSICRVTCLTNDNCDIENYHCENSVCMPGKGTVCGNGILEVGEDCDDGNRTAGDGCNANCGLEQGWKCVNQSPSTPNSVCNRTNGNCLSHFTGDNCDMCETGYTGPDCKAITCIHGTLDDESGICSSCNERWEGDNCDKCSGHFAGDNCRQCKTGWAGENCDKCDSNFVGENCDQCKDGFTGTDCSQCIDGTTGNKSFMAYTYNTVCINGKFWFAENLRNGSMEHYSPDGDSKNVEQYGFLYDWENAMKACPTGWRLPTKDEFLQLIGGTEVETGYYTNDIQDKSWISNAGNRTGFSALPAGFRSNNGTFSNFGSKAYFWSSTEDGNDYALMMIVVDGRADVGTRDKPKSYSIRCVQDSN